MANEPYILYIEDERSMMSLVCEVLKLADYNVVGAYSGREGLEKMQAQKPALLLLDLMMPDLNGRDVFRVMKNDEALADIPVIVVSAKIPEGGLTLVEGLPPVEDYITKPFEIDRLLKAIQLVLEP